MQKKLFGIGKLIAWIACLLGGFGSFMQWLGIKPKDLGMDQSTPVPHVLWLVLALVLFAIGIGSAIWAGIVQRIEIADLREAKSIAEEATQQCIEDTKDFARRNLEYRAQLERQATLAETS